MLTRTAHAAQIAAEQAAQQLAQQAAQQSNQQLVNDNRVVRFASRDQFFSPPPEQEGDSEMGGTATKRARGGNGGNKRARDGDGDTEMGSDTETVRGDDGDTEIGDDTAANTSEAPQTPTRTGTYKYGPVVRTSDKKTRASRRQKTVRKRGAKAHAPYPSPNKNANHKKPAASPGPTRKEEPYVLVPTFPKHGKGKPATKDNTPGPSNHGPSTPPTRREPGPTALRRVKIEASSLDRLVSGGLGPGWMLKNPVRWYRDRNGQFVRDGSLPPEYFAAEELKMVQPPRADSPPPEASQYERCDTEPLGDSEDEMPPPPGPVRRKRKTRAQAMAEIDRSKVRRSVRIMNMK